MRPSPPFLLPSRRDFLACFLLGKALSLSSGRAWAATTVAAILPANTQEPAVLRLRLADFDPLQAAFGSVRLSFGSASQMAPVPPFIISRDEDDFFAVSAECTHSSCIIPAFGSTKTSTCNCHGSRFGHDGRVIRGPADAALTRYETAIQEPGILQVFIPELPTHQVSIQNVIAPASPRVRLRFEALANVDYEVLHKPSPDADWTPHPFALTEDGPADRTKFRGATGETSVFIDPPAPAGLLTISARLRRV